MGVLHLEPAHIILHQHRDTAKVGVRADPSYLFVVELVDVDAGVLYQQLVACCAVQLYDTSGNAAAGAGYPARCETFLGSPLRDAARAKGREGASAQLRGKPLPVIISEARSLVSDKPTYPEEVEACLLEPREHTVGKPDVGHREVFFTSNLEALLHVWGFGADLREFLFVVDVLYNFLLAGRRVAYSTRLLSSACLSFTPSLTSVVGPRGRVRGQHLGFHRQSEESLRLEGGYP